MCSAASGTSDVPTRLRPSASTWYTCCMSVGKKPVPYMASSRTRTGHDHRAEALAGQLLEGVLHERELEEHQVALEIGEAAPRSPGAPLHVDHVELGGQVEVVFGREGELPGRAPGVHDHGVFLAAGRRRGLRQVGHL